MVSGCCSVAVDNILSILCVIYTTLSAFQTNGHKKTKSDPSTKIIWSCINQLVSKRNVQCKLFLRERHTVNRYPVPKSRGIDIHFEPFLQKMLKIMNFPRPSMTSLSHALFHRGCEMIIFISKSRPLPDPYCLISLQTLMIPGWPLG